MPKFTLYSIDNHPAGSREYRCEVGWDRQGGNGVHLGVTSIADGADRTEEYLPPPSAITTPTVRANTVTGTTGTTAASGWMRLSAGPGREATISGADGVHELIPAWQGWHMPLSRRQINQLIIELRRARDVAYGRDQ
jgi:hypothetical protein